ncbi:MAG: hypothetical protein ACREAC_08765, partial [Blastocatellia bacterium]
PDSRSQFGVRANDPLTVSASILPMAAVAALAMTLQARRASGFDQWRQRDTVNARPQPRPCTSHVHSSTRDSSAETRQSF